VAVDPVQVTKAVDPVRRATEIGFGDDLSESVVGHLLGGFVEW
jgi:hypothetical protein